MDIGFRPLGRKEGTDMYDNDLYSGEGAGTNTSGANSQQNQSNTENNSYNTGASGENSQTNGYSTSYGSDSYSSYNFGSSNNGSSNNSSNHYGSQDSSYGSGYSNSYANSNSSSGNSGKKHKEKKSGGFFKKALVSVCMGLFFGLFAGVGFYGVQYVTGSMISQGEQNAPVISNDVENQSEDLATDESKSGIKLTDTTEVRVVSSDVSDVVDEVMPAMVSIVNNYTETSTTFFGQSYTQEKAASGSGIIVGESETELLIVTNHHVVADATKLEVSFIDGSVAEAQIKGMDSDMDLAVIAIPLESLTEETKNTIAIATMGDSDALKLGEPVIAIGNALGYGQSVTNGIISALDREITIEDGSANSFIQTNAAINPGNSGGALLNINGEVIGINSNKIGATAVEGMGYAIPISAAEPIIGELMLKETRNKVEDGQVGYIGITPQTITSNYSQTLRIPQGVYVVEVQEGSPASEAGLLTGDIIVKFEGEKISTHEDLQNILQYYGAGSTVTVTVKRPQNGEYQSVDIQITLGTRPSDLQ